MKTTSMVQLLEVGNFLFHKQNQFKKVFDVEYEFLENEIKLVLQIILTSMGLLKREVDGNSSYVVHTDHYEHLTQAFFAYCKNELTTEEMVDLIYALKVEEKYVINGAPLSSGYPHSINALFTLKHSIQTKRQKLAHVAQEECDFMRAEKKIVEIALDELGNRRYFSF
ncbi:hypothetical protein [Ammoniphilus resinae]|uniref:Uncharacterized protein n=1 Tax=Ammoniphilus resinae TaxID=861532 RepID=A0ABS4GU84_9BACL|nr:hypothetical protein [Ammoniphilus resinae]MBP1933816.1 hypothetical protein [Ammoniphilus resinae]